MLIDWFTVGAQVLNFAVLLWLMQRFLYRPVLAAIDARETLIAGELADAAAKQRQASDERDAFLTKNAAFDAERATLLAEATATAADERKHLLALVVQDADAAAARRQAGVRAEAAALQHALGVRARQEVFAVARQTLVDLASASLEERIGAVFLDRLRALDGPARASWVAALADEAGPVAVRSAFVLDAAQRTRIEQAVHATFATTAVLRFETAPELVAGIELRAGGQRLEWSIAHHLDGLAQSVDDLVTQAASVAAPAVAEPPRAVQPGAVAEPPRALQPSPVPEPPLPAPRPVAAAA